MIFIMFDNHYRQAHIEYSSYTEAEKEAYYRDTDPLAKLIYRFEILFEFFF